PCSCICRPQLLVLPSFPTRRSSDLDLGHVARHDLVARLRHAGCFGKAPFRTAANAEEADSHRLGQLVQDGEMLVRFAAGLVDGLDRKSTRLNSSHVKISYAVFCLKK